jgi:hypothetical protein
VPSYSYLSIPVFLKLKELLSDQFKLVFFFTKDSTNIRFKKDFQDKDFQSKVKEYVEVKDSPWERCKN